MREGEAHVNFVTSGYFLFALWGKCAYLCEVMADSSQVLKAGTRRQSGTNVYTIEQTLGQGGFGILSVVTLCPDVN